MVSNEEIKRKLEEKRERKGTPKTKVKKFSKPSMIKSLRHKKTCLICGTGNPISANFCKNCGKSFETFENKINISSLKYLPYIDEKKEEEHLKRNMDYLVKSNNYTYVKDFVNRFGNRYTERDYKKLHETLNRKGFKIDERSELKSLINHIRTLERYKNFKSLLSHNNPVYVRDYLKRLINLYGDDYPHYLPKLRKLLVEEKGISQRRVDLVIAKFLEEEKEKNKLGSSILSKNQSYLSISEINSLNGFEFENLLHKLFQKMGFEVKSTKLTGDQGADLIINNQNDKIVVQAKRYKNNVGNKAIQEVVASIAHYGANKGMVVTNSQFTKSAIALAESNKIQLIDGDELKVLIDNYPINNNEI